MVLKSPTMQLSVGSYEEATTNNFNEKSISKRYFKTPDNEPENNCSVWKTSGEKIFSDSSKRINNVAEKKLSYESEISHIHNTSSFDEEGNNLKPKSHDCKEEIIQTVTNAQQSRLKTVEDRKRSFCDPDLSKIPRFNERRQPSERRWIVLLASFMALIVSTGFPFHMSILYVEFLMAFGKSKAVTSLVQSMSAGVFFISGCISGIIINKYGTRPVCIPAAIVASTAIGISFLADRIEVLVVTLGIFAAIGLSMSYIGTLSSVAEHFDGRSKPLALSFAVSGSGVGSITFPILLNLLISKYGWRGCLLVVSGIALNIVPCIAMCKPRCFSKQLKKQAPASDHGDKTDGKVMHWHHILRSLLRYKVYVLNTFALALSLPFCNAVLFMLMDFLIFKGFSRDVAVFLYFCMNITNACFRILPGFCKQIPHLSVFAIAIILSGLGTASLVVFPLANTYIQYLCIMCVFGASLGGITCMVPMTTMKIVGRDTYSTGLGLTLSVIGALNIASGPIVGFIRDVTGSYNVAFYVCGTCTGAACLLFCSALCLRFSNGLDVEFNIDKRKYKRRSCILPWKDKFNITM